MAVKLGKNSRVKIGTNEVAKLTSFSFPITHENVDVTSFGDDWMKTANVISSWNATIEGYVDDSDVYNRSLITQAVSGGSIDDLRFYEDAVNYWTPDTGTDAEASAVLESISQNTDKSGIVSFSISVKGHGPIHRTTGA